MVMLLDLDMWRYKADDRLQHTDGQGQKGRMCGKTLDAMTHGQAHGQDTRIVTDAVMDTDTDKTRHTDKPRG